MEGGLGSLQVANHSLIADPTACVPGFDLPRHLWVQLNGFRTDQGHCAAHLGLTNNPLCSFGELQTMSHIVDVCPSTKFPGGLWALHCVDDAAAE